MSAPFELVITSDNVVATLDQMGRVVLLQVNIACASRIASSVTMKPVLSK